MGWFLIIAMQAVFLINGYRQEKATGQWSWSKLVFALAFAALEGTLLLAPIFTMDIKSPRFLPTFGAAAVIAALNFIWFIVVCRRWKLPDGRTSLQAYYDEHPEKKRPADV